MCPPFKKVYLFVYPRKYVTGYVDIKNKRVQIN